MGKGPAEDKVEVSAPPEASMPYDKQGGETKAEAMANGGAVTPQMTMLTASEPVRPPPQKAVVKPNVLTHVIEGYIIQEGPEPFPVSRSSLIAETESPKPSAETNGKVENEELQQVAQGKITKKKKMGRKSWRKVQVTNLPAYSADKWPQQQPQLQQQQQQPQQPQQQQPQQQQPQQQQLQQQQPQQQQPQQQQLQQQQPQQQQPQQQQPQQQQLQQQQLQHQQPQHQQPQHQQPQNQQQQNQQQQAQQQQVPQQQVPQQQQAACKDKVQAMDTSTEQPPAREADLPSFPGAEQPLHKPESSVESPAAAPTEMEVDASPAALPSKSPRIWTVQEVADYIQELPGCTDYAEEFRSQEIDGQALLLLKEDHLMTAMNIKLGPALKICAKINSLREEQ